MCRCRATSTTVLVWQPCWEPVASSCGMTKNRPGTPPPAQCCTSSFRPLLAQGFRLPHSSRSCAVGICAAVTVVVFCQVAARRKLVVCSKSFERVSSLPQVTPLAGLPLAESWPPSGTSCSNPMETLTRLRLLVANSRHQAWKRTQVHVARNKWRMHFEGLPGNMPMTLDAIAILGGQGPTA